MIERIANRGCITSILPLTLFPSSLSLSLSAGIINFVTADGVMFAHPLHHLGKTKKVKNQTIAEHCYTSQEPWESSSHVCHAVCHKQQEMNDKCVLIPPQDLPLIAIDSFRHMYLFPYFEDIK